MASTSTCSRKFQLFLLLLFGVILVSSLQSCYGQQTFGFDVHHRFSDPIRQMFPGDHLPEKGTFDYYKALAHRDLLIHGRRLASTADQILAFADGNITYRIDEMGYLHYANVSLGTPSVNFFVALDTGSDIFWVPCDCKSCAHTWQTGNGDVINLNIYHPSASSTSQKVSCNSSLCEQPCPPSGDSTCLYQVAYLSAVTSSSGYLVEDVLHMTTDYSNPEAVDPRITFGCGQFETGSFVTGAAVNGLFGLGLDKLSVPSLLSSEGLIANSFSMCFGSDGIGRINFGDKGSSDQAETPFSVNGSNPTYNISVTQMTVGTEVVNASFTAIFDTGTSFTYLNDPAYTTFAESFSAQVKDTLRQPDQNSSFEYCYDTSSTSDNLTIPDVNMTMGGGSQYQVFDPIVVFIDGNTSTISYYCLALVKSSDVNIIGQNFMTDYLIVFNREELVLGWKKSNCYDTKYISTSTQGNTTNTPPATAVQPPETSTTGVGSSSGAPSALVRWSPLLKSISSCFLINGRRRRSSLSNSNNQFIPHRVVMDNKSSASMFTTALAHRDLIIHGSRLASTSTADQILAFADGNTTYRIDDMDYLHYANVSLGTPSVNFFVALDTGSDIFWVPCDCKSCAHTWQTGNGDVINLNIYHPNLYIILPLFHLLDILLRYATDYSNPEAVDPRIAFGEGIIANSFSMCFGSDGIGRINFGVSSDQAETSFSVNGSKPKYNISVTQMTVGTEVVNASFTAIFDIGTSFAYLSDPAYTYFAASFSAQVKDARRQSDPNSSFEYCYDTSSTSDNLTIPEVILTMGGGSQYHVFDPIVVFVDGNASMISYYCLALVKRGIMNIIGQNFMTDHLIVFGREKLVLGWKKSNCNPTNAPPATALQPPEASTTGVDSFSGALSALVAWSPLLNSINFCLLIYFLVLFAMIWSFFFQSGPVVPGNGGSS
ncbi:hypothetical protein NE237_022836 [Protea cynaroides]|uniref:Peptidase A1 domain-containing protein n=1 Tax=Protea cynaroides TaxID=273540 RepID=A0A9Q0K4V0_9MAGN|nr:hypothetical protein NE237_022836 [Protea cynaroides]